MKCRNHGILDVICRLFDAGVNSQPAGVTPHTLSHSHESHVVVKDTRMVCTLSCVVDYLYCEPLRKMRLLSERPVICMLTSEVRDLRNTSPRSNVCTMIGRLFGIVRRGKSQRQGSIVPAFFYLRVTSHELRVASCEQTVQQPAYVLSFSPIMHRRTWDCYSIGSRCCCD